MFHDGEDINIITSYAGRDEKELGYLGYKCDLFCAKKVQLALQSLYKKSKINIFLECESNYDIQKQVVLVGGSAHNRLSKEILSKSHIPYYIDDEHRLINRNAPEIFYEAKEVNLNFTEDYALVLNCINPMNRRNRMVLIAGCRGLGCEAAGQFLYEANKEVHSKLKENPNKSFAIILKCTSHYNSKGNPTMNGIGATIENIQFFEEYAE